MVKRVILLLALLCPLLAKSFGFKAEEVYNEGMRWEGYYESFPPGQRYYFDFFIDGVTEVLGEKCYKLWSLNKTNMDTQLAMLVRAEGSRVYYVTSLDATQWSLLYDFDVALFQECSLQYPMPWGTDSATHTFNLRCLQWYDVYDTDPGYEMMFLQKFDEDFAPEGYAGQWIRGFGNVGFPTQNIIGMDGEMRSRLVRAYRGEKVFYDNKTLAIDQTLADEFTVEQQGLTVIINGVPAGQPLQLISLDGNVLLCSHTTDAPVKLDLPDSGIYILRVGDITKKIVVQ
ncbi:MAG: T9SS type A sorting domain-containing protein [Muribaculaceae bacterium]|nr:T9SS type A sorting domain-containing protein [Muribaculaceae bacterium]